MTVTKMEPAHVPAAARLERLCFSAPWSERELLSALEMPGSVYFAALEGDELCGYAGMYTAAELGEINNIAVDPEYRRRGVATALLSALCAHARKAGLSKLTLEVRASNFAALSLYGKNGFYRVGQRRGYYTAPKEDAVLLDKDI